MNAMEVVGVIEGFKNVIIKFLQSPITGSVVGIIGLIVTWITWRTTKKIEKRLPEEKAAALDKVDFAKYRESFINAVQTKRKAAQEAEVVSRNVRDDIIQILIKLQRFNNIISVDDMKVIKEQQEALEKLNNSKNISKEAMVTEFVVITTRSENVLEKGVYKL